MIPYMVGKLASNSTHSTRVLIEYVPGRGYFRAVSSQNGDKFVTSPPPPIVERVLDLLSIPQSGGKNVKTFRWDHRLQIQNLLVAFKRVPLW